MSWRIIRVTSSKTYSFASDGLVEYRPSKKFLIEKKNAFDPSIIHRRGGYRQDTFDLEAIIFPASYDALVTLLTDDGMLYLEFSNKQFPVTVSQLPKCPDDLQEYPEKIKFSLESRYVGSPGHINFNTITVSDFNEIVI
ncbi:MAG: hypothetical protein PHY48_16560 [Candidatus Cloacimonetes bacterium]|nr:hypothetical protein [Candidatus Cloacimonadota bacterium]